MPALRNDKQIGEVDGSIAMEDEESSRPEAMHRLVEIELKARGMTVLAKVFYLCSMAIAFLCEIAAATIFTAIMANKLSDQSDNWIAVWFFAVAGGVAWIVGHWSGSSST